MGRETWAQGHTPDPYNIVGEYNRQYEPYMGATFPTEEGTLPNQARLEERSSYRTANQFQNYVESLDGAEDEGFRTVSPRLSGPGTPYYRANRRFDEAYQRTYRPNTEADRRYYTEQDRRNSKYFRAMNETDPRKRAQLLREYNLDNLRAARSLSRGRTALDQDAERDRLTPGGGSSALDDDATPPPARRSPVLPSPSSPTGRSRSSAPPPPGVPGISPASPLSSVGSATRNGRATVDPLRRNRSASDVLERSELIDRANRRTAPVPPRSTAPPPPSSPATR